MSASIICGPCDRVSRRNSAQKLCTNCGEGFCADCEQTHRSMMVTADHTLISTNEVHDTDNSAVIMICDIHGNKFDLYCKTHELVICVACLPSKHIHCSDAVISNRNVAMQNFEVQEQSIRKSIGEIRTNLNKHLDKIEKKLLDELSELYTRCKSKYGKVLKTFHKTENEIKLLQIQTSQLKRLGSDIQVFLGTRQITELINVQIHTVKSVVRAIQENTIEIDRDAPRNNFIA
ncbi:tripartite motif-containing protein 29-like [Mytilus edulis]|uniref:tripartite motif-containing protein 29-like n=1 Tax=Mytilus edulis TaxID=6550 RepID=UPI0039EF435E